MRALLVAIFALAAEPCSALVAGAAFRAGGRSGALDGAIGRRTSLPLSMAKEEGSGFSMGGLLDGFKKKEPEAPTSGVAEKDEDEWTLDKVASLGLAGVLSIAVAESVFWVLSFPISEVLYFVSTGEWINLLEQVLLPPAA